MIKCEEASLLSSDKLDHPLSRSQQFILRLHLLMCRKCRAFSLQIKALRDVFQNWDNITPKDDLCLSKDSKEEIKLALQKKVN